MRRQVSLKRQFVILSNKGQRENVSKSIYCGFQGKERVRQGGRLRVG